jgi:hypothetical protein
MMRVCFTEIASLHAARTGELRGPCAAPGPHALIKLEPEVFGVHSGQPTP